MTDSTRRRRRRRAIQVPEGTIEVTRVGYGEEQEPERIVVPSFEGEVAQVRVEGSVTQNMGDMNFIKVGVAVTLPCYPTSGDIREAKDEAGGMVDEFIREELEAATGEQTEDDSPRSSAGRR